MTYFIQTNKNEAENIKKILIEHNIYNKGIKAQNDKNYVYFPITTLNPKIKILKKYKIVNKKSEKYITTKSFKDILVNEFKIKDYISSYDTLGDIAIIKITKEMEEKEREIAKRLLEINPSLKTIVKKISPFEGEYRVEKVKYLAGKKSFTTIINENNCKFKVELGKMFFSTRLSFERTRVSEFIKDNKTVGVFFSGVGPFSIVIGKKHPNCKVYSIELNKEAHKMALENIILNKINNVKPICADVYNYAKKIENKCDYIIMPLPKTSDLFLEAAYKAIKKNTGIITLYKFVDNINPYKEILKELKEFAKKKNKKIKVIFKRKVRDYSPDIIQIVIDFKIID